MVQAKDGRWFILEDNLRIPSGASYPMIARTITRKVSPDTFQNNAVADNRNYSDLLREMMEHMNHDRGLTVILTPGRYNSAFFEHSYLAEKTGALLAFPGDLMVADDSGVCIVPYELAEPVLEQCLKIAASEERMRQLIESKAPISELRPLFRARYK